MADVKSSEPVTRTGPARVLVMVGRHGTTLLLFAIAAGLLVPQLAEACKPLIPVSVAMVTLGSFLVASFTVQGDRYQRYVTVVVLWVIFAPPLLCAAALRIIPLDAGMAAAALLVTLAPPSGSNAAIASILKLSPKLSLIGTVSATLMTPLTLPLLSRVLGQEVQVTFLQLEARILPIIGGAWLVSHLIGRRRAVFDWLIPEPAAASGISLLGLIVLCLGTMTGVREHWVTDGSNFLYMTAAAIGVAVALQAAGTVALIKLGVKDALTVGFMSGTRNVGLAWAAAAGALTEQGHAFLSASVLPVYLLPFFSKQASRLFSPKHEAAPDTVTLTWFDHARPDLIHRVTAGEGAVLRVGRSLDADIRFDDPTVSRAHAELTIGADTATVTDMNSGNGIIVDGRRMPAAELRGGSICELGQSSLRFDVGTGMAAIH